MKLLAQNLNFPTSVAVDRNGQVYVAESGVRFDGPSAGGAVFRLEPDGHRICLIEGLRAPVNGLTYSDGWLFIAEGGHPGRISRLCLATGKWLTVIDDLPGFGNYHTNMCVIGTDHKLYFSQGAMTNSGIIGLDSQYLGWLRKVPHNCDIPGFDIILTGVNAETIDPEAPNQKRVWTGAFSPFGTPTRTGQLVPGQAPCTSAIMRCNADGSDLELVAWGIRNAYGLGYLPDGRLLAIDQGADDRGSRPIAHCPDFLFEIRKDCWYGWPDFVGGLPVTHSRFHAEHIPPPQFLIANHPDLPSPQPPLLEFEVNSSAIKFGIVPADAPYRRGHLVVAMFGDEGPLTGAPETRIGRKLVRVDPNDWSVHPMPSLPLLRPIDVAFAPSTYAMYVLDFGEFEITPEKGVAARPASGALWELPAEFLAA